MEKEATEPPVVFDPTDDVELARAYSQPQHAQPERALVHATLALAAEQRTANLIAYVTHLERQYQEAARNADAFDRTTLMASLARYEAAQKRIREALGL